MRAENLLLAAAVILMKQPPERGGRFVCGCCRPIIEALSLPIRLHAIAQRQCGPLSQWQFPISNQQPPHRLLMLLA